ncbi:MAG: DUF1097 domain-containing protein [Dorea sp.]
MKHKIDWWQVLCIGMFPPMWAMGSSMLSIETGAVALICTGLYVANAKRADAAKITAGFLLGDLWAGIAMTFQTILPLEEFAGLFVTLCILGMLAVIISDLLPGYVSCAAWLCGWAIGLTVLGYSDLSGGLKSIVHAQIQTAIAMFIGVWYVGVFVGYIHDMLEKKIHKFR